MRIVNALSATNAANAAQLGTIGCFIEPYYDDPPGDWYLQASLYCRPEDTEAIELCRIFGNEKSKLPNGAMRFENMFHAGLANETGRKKPASEVAIEREQVMQSIGLYHENLCQRLLK